MSDCETATVRSAARIGWIVRRAFDAAAGLAALAAMAVFVGIGLLPHTGLYRPETVLSGSMRPAFAPGDLVVVAPEPARDLRVGQIISYAIPVGDHHVETHRIVKIVQRGSHAVIRTKGDANDGVDPWTARLDGDTAWTVRAVVPHLGWLVVLLRSPVLHLLTVFAAPLLLALMWLLRIWRVPETEESGDGAPSATPA
jgi:signal peptidase